MGACTSSPTTPPHPLLGQTIEENTFRIRQLDDRMRKKNGMVLRLTEHLLIIEQRGKRHKPELTASLFPDKTKYSIQRYGVPDVSVPSILIDLKGPNGKEDSKYMFYCKDNNRLYEKLKTKIDQAQKRTSSIHSHPNSRMTPLPTPTPKTPSRIPELEPPFNPNEVNYANKEAMIAEESRRHLSSTSTPKFASNQHHPFQPTPLSPVIEQEKEDVRILKLDRPPTNRAEMNLRKEGKNNPPLFDSIGQNNPWPKPPPRPSHTNLYQNAQTEFLSRTSLSTRSSGLNMNQLSARSDCEPLLLSNLSTPNNYNTRVPRMINSNDHLYANLANKDEYPGNRTPSFAGSFTAPPSSYSKRFVFPPMEELKRRDVGSMNYVTVEHNSLSSSNSTPRTPKTPGASVQYTPVDFQKTDELHKSQSIIRSDSKRSRSSLLPQK